MKGFYSMLMILILMVSTHALGLAIELKQDHHHTPTSLNKRAPHPTKFLEPAQGQYLIVGSYFHVKIIDGVHELLQTFTLSFSPNLNTTKKPWRRIRVEANDLNCWKIKKPGPKTIRVWTITKLDLYSVKIKPRRLKKNKNHNHNQIGFCTAVIQTQMGK